LKRIRLTVSEHSGDKVVTTTMVQSFRKGSKEREEQWENYDKTNEGNIPYLECLINGDRSIIESGKKTLEIGIGKPQVWDVYRGRDKLFAVFDLSQRALKHAKKMYKPSNRGIFVRGDLEQIAYLPFPDNFFDHTVCINTLSIVGPRVPRILMEMRRVTNYGGKIVVTVPHENSFSPEERKEMEPTLSGHLKLVNFKGMGNWDAVFTEHGLRGMLNTLGFGDRDIQLHTYKDKDAYPPIVVKHLPYPHKKNSIRAIIRKSSDELLPSIYHSR
jgi:ubiquinone/menaquinone biosynthesis C-methylase UbiE